MSEEGGAAPSAGDVEKMQQRDMDNSLTGMAAERGLSSPSAIDTVPEMLNEMMRPGAADMTLDTLWKAFQRDVRLGVYTADVQAGLEDLFNFVVQLDYIGASEAAEVFLMDFFIRINLSVGRDGLLLRQLTERVVTVKQPERGGVGTVARRSGFHFFRPRRY